MKDKDILGLLSNPTPIKIHPRRGKKSLPSPLNRRAPHEHGSILLPNGTIFNGGDLLMHACQIEIDPRKDTAEGTDEQVPCGIKLGAPGSVV